MAFMKDTFVGTVPFDTTAITYYDSDPESTDAQTIVLLHGTGGSAENNFWALFPMLAMRHRVLALDFIDPEAGAVDGDYYLRQVRALVKQAAGRGAVHLVGYSFGAVIAASYAACDDSSLASLTLIAGWAKTDKQQQLRNDVWRSLYESKHEALAGFSVLTSFSQAFLNAKNESELNGLLQAVKNGPDRSVKMTFNRDVDISDSLFDIAVPSLVIGCKHDQMVPIRHSRMLFGAIKDCRYAEINSGHGVVHERPSELFNMIDMFVRDPLALPAGETIENTHV
ncbi:MAG: alpha/beta hydrolase [Burkholderiaceae bacterium]